MNLDSDFIGKGRVLLPEGVTRDTATFKHLVRGMDIAREVNDLVASFQNILSRVESNPVAIVPAVVGVLAQAIAHAEGTILLPVARTTVEEYAVERLREVLPKARELVAGLIDKKPDLLTDEGKATLAAHEDHQKINGHDGAEKVLGAPVETVEQPKPDEEA